MLNRIRVILRYPSLVSYTLTHPHYADIKSRYRYLRSLEIPYTPPFHGDRILQSLIEEVIVFFNVSTFFETGTYRGESLNYICERFYKDIRIISCETNKEHYEYSTERLKGHAPTIFNLSSPEAIRLSSRFSLLGSLPLFYLDAHWNEYWPLLDELKEIIKLKQAIIIIDDFKVPSHPELGYDSYRGNENSLEYVDKVLHFTDDSFNILLPNYHVDAEWPEPKRDMRGYAIVFMNLEDKFKEFSQTDVMRNFDVIE